VAIYPFSAPAFGDVDGDGHLEFDMWEVSRITFFSARSLSYRGSPRSVIALVHLLAFTTVVFGQAPAPGSLGDAELTRRIDAYVTAYMQ
jgi:hypothetical protein